MRGCSVRMISRAEALWFVERKIVKQSHRQRDLTQTNSVSPPVEAVYRSLSRDVMAVLIATVLGVLVSLLVTLAHWIM